MVEKLCELKENSKVKMDGGTKAVQAVSQNSFFKAPPDFQQISNGTFRLNNKITEFASDYRQSALSQYLSKEKFSQQAGSTLPSQTGNRSAQNLHHEKSHQYGAPYNSANVSYANVRPPVFQQYHSRAFRNPTSSQDYNRTSLEYQQHQNYYVSHNYEHATNALPQPLHAHASSQQTAVYRTIQRQATVANGQNATINGLDQNPYGHHQPPSYATSVAAQMTLHSEDHVSARLASGLLTHLSNPPGVHQKEGASLPKPIESKQLPFHSIPMEVQRLLHLRSQYMKLSAEAQNQQSVPSGTQNGFHMIPNQPTRDTGSEIHYLAADGYSHSSVASDSNHSSHKESSISPSRCAPVDANEIESYASTPFQVNKLHSALGNERLFATSKSAVDQNPNAASRIPMQGHDSIGGLNGITDCARKTVENHMDLSMEKGYSVVTGEDLLKLHKEVMGMREQFVHLLRDYKQKYIKFHSASSDPTLPASHLHVSNPLKSNGEDVPDAKSVLSDNTSNFQSAPATSKHINQNSHQGSHQNQTSLDSVHNSNQLDNTLQVMQDSSTVSAPASVSSTINEKPNFNNFQIKNCQQSKQSNLFVRDTTNFEHTQDFSHCNKDIALESNRETASTSPSQFNPLCVSPSEPSAGVAVPEKQKTASTSPSQFNPLCVSPSEPSAGVAVPEKQKTWRFKNYVPNQKHDVTDSQSLKVTKRRKKAASLSFAPITAETAMKQLKDISLLDDLWKKKPSKNNQINSPPCPNLDCRPVSSSEMSISSNGHVRTEHTVVGREPDTMSSSVAQPVEPSNEDANPLNPETKSKSTPLVQNLGKDVQETFAGQFAKQNEQDMSLSHQYRMTINSLLDKLDFHSTVNCADTEEMASVDDNSKSGKIKEIKSEPCESVTENMNSPESGNVMQIKTEPCESVTENTHVGSPESGNVVQIKTEACENTASPHLKCVHSKSNSSPLCQPKSSLFQTKDVRDPLLKIESICSLVEGNTFYDSQVAHVFDTNNVQGTKDFDKLSNNVVKPQTKVETIILPNGQCFGDSKGTSDFPLHYPHPSQTTQTNIREGDLSPRKEHSRPLPLKTAQSCEENICAKDVSEPYLYSQLSELLRAFPFGIEQTESAPLIKVDEAAENKGMHDCQLSNKQKEHNVQKCKMFPSKSFPKQSLLISKSSTIALDERGSTGLQKALKVQIDSKHPSLDKCDYKKPATVGHISVTVVDSKQIIINVIESPTELDEANNLKDSQDVPNFPSEAKIVIEAKEQALGDPCRKLEDILLDSDDEVIWVKTEAPPLGKSTAVRTPTAHHGMVDPLEKDTSLASMHSEVSEKSDCKDSPIPTTHGGPDCQAGAIKKIKKTSRLIVKTDFLKSKPPRLSEPVKSGEIQVLHRKTAEKSVEKRCKIDKVAVTNFLSNFTDSGIKKKPATGDQSISTTSVEKLAVGNTMSNTHNNSAVGKDNTCSQAMQEYFQRRREETMSAGKKIPKGYKEAKCDKTNALTPYKKTSVDLGKLKRIVMQTSKCEKENVSKHMQSLEKTGNDMPLPTTARVSSPPSVDLKLCIEPNLPGLAENDSTSKHLGGHNYVQERSSPSSTKSAEIIGTDFIKRVSYLGSSNGIIQLSPFDFTLLKESDRTRRQRSCNPPLRKPKKPILQTVSGQPQMLEFKMCPNLLMEGHLAADESTGGKKHHAGVEHQKGNDSKTDDCSNIPFKKRKVDMAEFHGSVVVQESTAVGQMTATAELTVPKATSNSQDLFNTYKKMYQDKQKTGLPNLS